MNATAIGDFVEAIQLFNEVNGTGFDGIVVPTETVVFESTQIKSATDNVGTFDPENPDIRYSKRTFADGTEYVHVDTEQEYFAGYTGNELRKRALWDDALVQAMENVRNAQAEQGSDTVTNDATDNVGTFDPENPDIRYKKRDTGEEIKNIKGQIKANMDILNTMDVVDVVNADIPASNNPGVIRKWAIEQLKVSGYKVERKEIGTIEFPESRIKNSLNYLHEKGEIAAFAAIPRVLKRGIIIHDHQNHKYRGFPTITFAAPVVINGVRGNMAIVVKQESSNVYKTHRILMPDGSAFEYKEKAKPSTARGVAVKGSYASPISSASGLSVPQPGDSVKKYSLRTLTPSDREMLLTMADRYAVTKPQQEQLARYRKKMDELSYKRIQLSEIQQDIRRRQKEHRDDNTTMTGTSRNELYQQKQLASMLAEQIDAVSNEIYRIMQTKPVQTMLEDVMFVVNSQEKVRRKEFVQKYREDREKTDIRRKIRVLCDDFDRRLKSPTESRYIPKELATKVIAVRELINVNSDRARKPEYQQKLDEKIAAIKAVYERYKAIACTSMCIFCLTTSQIYELRRKQQEEFLLLLPALWFLRRV